MMLLFVMGITHLSELFDNIGHGNLVLANHIQTRCVDVVRLHAGLLLRLHAG